MKSKNYLNRALFLVSLFAVLSLGCSPDNQEETSNNPNYESEVITKAHAATLNFTTSLKGSNEVPANDSNGAGVAIVKISKDGNSISYKLNTANVENVFAAHFHLAPAGSNGGVVATLYSNPNQPSGPDNGVLAQGTITAAEVSGSIAGDLDALIAAIKDGLIYINVHTSDVPSGELRGQL